MYTRAFYEDEGRVPESYGGSAFAHDAEPAGGTYVPPTTAIPKISPQIPPPECEMPEKECASGGGGILSSLLQWIPFKGFSRGKLPLHGILERGIRVEDILIAAVGILLIFSREGDTLFGIMLLALLLLD